MHFASLDKKKEKFQAMMLEWWSGGALDLAPPTHLYTGEAGVRERSGEERLPALRFGDIKPHPHWSSVCLNIKPHLQEKNDQTINTA